MSTTTATPRKRSGGKGALPADLRPEHVTAIVDTREQHPFELAPLASIVAGLTAGDYSILGLEHLVAIERKSLPDLIGCCGVERERFERELQRLLAYPTRCVVVEASWADIQAGGWRSNLTPKSATGSVLAWIGSGVPFLFAGDRQAAQQATARLLYLAARRRWRELRALATAAEGGPA
ncbi:MAG: ERCC4 domain-containing protein [Pirellulales bacterium]